VQMLVKKESSEPFAARRTEHIGLGATCRPSVADETKRNIGGGRPLAALLLGGSKQTRNAQSEDQTNAQEYKRPKTPKKGPEEIRTEPRAGQGPVPDFLHKVGALGP